MVKLKTWMWLGLAGGSLALGGCMGASEEPAFKIVSKPAAPKASLAPNITVQRKLENPLAPPRTSTQAAPTLIAQAPLTPKPEEAKADPKPLEPKKGREGVDRGPSRSRDRETKRVEGEPKRTESGEKLAGGKPVSIPDEKAAPAAAAETAPAVGMDEEMAPPAVALSAKPSGSRLGVLKKPNLPSDLPSWYAENDQDGDGMVHLHEWPKDKRDEFRKYDRNSDGIVTIDEAMRTVPRAKAAVAAGSSSSTAAPAPVVVNWPSEIDESTKSWAKGTMARYAKKDPAKISQDEMPFYLKKERFGEFDKNKDGALDHVELAFFWKGTNVPEPKTPAAEPAPGAGGERRVMTFGGDNGGGMGGGRRSFGPGGGDNGGRSGFGGPGGGDNGGGMNGGRRGFGPGGGDPDAFARQMFDRMDKNKKGKLTKDDFPDYWKDRHAEYDTNKDGAVDFEEYKAGMAKRMRRG